MAQTSLNRAARKQPWLRLFLDFITKLRIDSKEASAEDDRGSALELWESQRRLLEEVCDGLERGQRTFYVLKSRQLGVSTISLAIDLFWLSTHPRMIGALVFDSPENREAFRDTLKRYIKSFPPGYLAKSGIKWKHNVNYLLFPNGSRLDYLVAGKRSKTWGEGKGYAFAHCTEIAKYGEADGVDSFVEALAQENEDRFFLFESTAFGVNHWKAMWDSAANDPTVCRIFIGWWAQPTNHVKKNDSRFPRFGVAPPSADEAKLINDVANRFGHIVTSEQLAWYRWRQSRGGQKQTLDQNNPWIPEQAFIIGGYSFFQAERIQQRYEAICLEQSQDRLLFKAYKYHIGQTFWATRLEEIHDENRFEEIELKIWEEPVKEAQYVIGMDPSFTREDWSANCAIFVGRCYADRVRQVAEYCSKKAETNQAAWVLAHIAGAYRNCMVNIDLQGPGRMVMKEFDNIRYQLKAEIYERKVQEYGWEDFLENARWYMYHKPDSPGAGFVWNFESNWRTKWELMNLYRDLFVTELFEINSIALLEEMATMVQEKSTIAPSAPGSLLDDRVFAAAYALRTYYDHLQKPLIASGAMYEIVTRRELGVADGPADLVDRLVYDWFRNAEELKSLEEERDPPKSWLQDRGFAA